MQYSIIQKSQLEGALRLDAEYYQPEYLKMKNKLTKHKNVFPLFELVDIKTGPAYSSEKIGEVFEIPLARIGDVTNKNDIENWLRLSENEFKKFNSSKISNGDILMTMTGDPPDVGKVNFINNKTKTILAFNQRVAKLHLKSNKVSDKYLFAYLSNEFSRFQIERAALGIRQRNLGMEDLKNILVVIPDEFKNIENLIDKYLRELENSKLLHQQAENLLLEELGLKDFETENSLFSVVNLSEVENADRIDAEYFQEKYKKLVKKIKQNNAKKLGDLVSIKKGFEPGSEEYYEEGKLFIRVSSLSVNGIENSDQKYLSEKLYQELKNDYEPKVGEILLTKDASPGIAYAIKEPVEGIMSGGILRLKLNPSVSSGLGNINTEYLTLCLNSIVGKMQAERDSGGSVIAHWKPEQIKNIVIPILPASSQKTIGDMLIQSFSARKRAKELLEEAKLKVEEMIEGKK